MQQLTLIDMTPKQYVKGDFDIYDQLSMSYNDYVSWLKGKYGEVEDSYFTDAECMHRNSAISRTRDGLFVHHIDEDKYPKLSSTKEALQAPFECQGASHLVYADALEHLILHIMITRDTRGQLGIGGAFMIMQEISDYFERHTAEYGWRRNTFAKIKDKRDVYLFIIHFFIKVVLIDDILEGADPDSICWVVKWAFYDSTGCLYVDLYEDYIKEYGKITVKG